MNKSVNDTLVPFNKELGEQEAPKTIHATIQIVDDSGSMNQFSAFITEKMLADMKEQQNKLRMNKAKKDKNKIKKIIATKNLCDTSTRKNTL